MADWLENIEGLDEALVTDPTLNKYDGIPAALAGLKEANERLGGSIRIPGPEAGPEAHQAYRDKLMKSDPGLVIRPDPEDEEAMKGFLQTIGVPSNKDGYTNPEGFEGLPDDVLQQVVDISVAGNLSIEQHHALLHKFKSLAESGQNSQEAAKAEDRAVVKGEWGLADDSKRERVTELVKQFQHPDHPLGELNAAGWFLLDRIADTMSGKGPQAHEHPTDNAAVTPSEARERSAEILKRLSSENLPREKRTELLQRHARYLEMAAG
jgi:hypothetical protein